MKHVHGKVKEALGQSQGFPFLINGLPRTHHLSLGKSWNFSDAYFREVKSTSLAGLGDSSPVHGVGFVEKSGGGGWEHEDLRGTSFHARMC